MNDSARQHYLETQVLTATPEKLQLMLIDAAIRAAHRAAEHWQRQENEQACLALVRAQEVVTALLKGLNREASPDLTGKMASVYMFIFRTLVEANLRRDPDLLADAVRVLSAERETWRLVCERAADDPVERSPSEPEQPARPHTPPLLNLPVADADLAGGVSIPA